MRRKSTQVMILSLLLSGAAAVYGGYAYAATDDDESSTTVSVEYPPYKPSDLSASVGEVANGVADVTLTFTTPSKSYDSFWEEVLDADDYPLTEITKIVVAERYYDEDEWEYVYNEIATVTENIKIGAEMSVVLKDQAEGKHTYYVFALNSKSKSKLSSNTGSSTSTTVTVGAVYEAPEAVKNLTVSNKYPNITLTWDAPTVGVDGGTIKADELTYTVYRNNEEIESDLTETTFTDVLSLDKPTSVQYAVVASTKAGNSYQTKSDSFVAGPAYSLPFTESFTDGSATKVWTKNTQGSAFSISPYASYGVSTGFGSTFKGGYDEDGGALYIKCNSAWYDEDEDVTDTYGTYTSAQISLKDAKKPALSFYHYIVPNAKNNLKTSIIVEADGVKETVAEYTYTEEGTEGWVLRSIDLSKFVGKDISLTFRGDCTNDKPGFTAFDVITVDEVNDYDLVLNSLNAPASVNAGDEFTVSAEVYNKGSKAAENFTVELYLNGSLYNSESVASLASGETKTVTFKGTAKNSFTTSAAFSAKVVFADDQVTDNNTAEATMNVATANTPAVSDLAATADGSTVSLSWTAPDYLLPAAQKVTEGFENYAHKAKAFGDWTMSDAHSYAPDFEDMGLDEDEFTGTATFTVVDSEEIGTDWGGKAASGTHYLMNVGKYYSSRTDWLISPVLSGAAQTVTFKVASRKFVQDWYGDTAYDHVKVYYSTTENNKSDFKETVASEDIKVALKNGDDYQTVSADLPEGAKYFAIVISNPEDEGDSVVFIDDITFEQGAAGVQAELLGYNVFEGENQLNTSLLTSTSFTIDDVATGQHTYTVVAVYNVGDSEASNTASIETSAVNDLLISNDANAEYFNLQGVRIDNPTRGQVVIKRQGNKATKVIIK